MKAEITLTVDEVKSAIRDATKYVVLGDLKITDITINAYGGTTVKFSDEKQAEEPTA